MTHNMYLKISVTIKKPLRHGRKIGRGKETFSAGEILVGKELMAAVLWMILLDTQGVRLIG